MVGPLATSLVVLFAAILVVSSPNASALATGARASTVRISLGAPSTAPPTFWGMDFVAAHGQGSIPGLAKTPTQFLIYPAGNATEQFNISTGILTTPHHSTRAPTPIQQFIADCESVSCSAGIGLPMEINSPATDAYEAWYVVHVLGFHPAYFSYGNEPSTYLCFGLSWSQVASGVPCDSGTSPAAFAAETAAAIQAVRTVLGPETPPAVCLSAGTGAGWTGVLPWLGALESNIYDASACWAFAAHVKPAASQLVLPTLLNLYSSFTGNHSLPAIYDNLSRATAGKPLLMTEVGAFTPHSVFTAPFTGTWPAVVGQSALVIQSMQIHLPLMGYWAWNVGGGLYGSANVTFYDVYSKLIPHLGSTWMSTPYTGQEGVLAEVTEGSGAWSLFVVSLNITTSFHVTLTGSGLPLGKATLFVATSAGLSKQTKSVSNGFTLPPQSVVLVTGTL